jgi:hypothetical protein
MGFEPTMILGELYVGLMALFRVEEIGVLWSALRRRLGLGARG